MPQLVQDVQHFLESSQKISGSKKQQQILEALKSSPQIMAMFLKKCQENVVNSQSQKQNQQQEPMTSPQIDKNMNNDAENQEGLKKKRKLNDPHVSQQLMLYVKLPPLSVSSQSTQPMPPAP